MNWSCFSVAGCSDGGVEFSNNFSIRRDASEMFSPGEGIPPKLRMYSSWASLAFGFKGECSQASCRVFLNPSRMDMGSTRSIANCISNAFVVVTLPVRKIRSEICNRNLIAGMSESAFLSNHAFNRWMPSWVTRPSVSKPSCRRSLNNWINSLPVGDAHCVGLRAYP